ncbi:MAG: hypothetical protein ACPG2Q_04235 [Pseudohongiellaceae bacterium]
MPVAELKKGALTLAGFLDALRDEGKITEADCATALRSSQAAEHQGKHILEIVADFEFVDLQDKEGMLSLRLSGAQKVASGLTTINEVLRVTPDMQE